MPTVLHLNPEDIDTKEKREKYTVGIIGCRERGIIYAISFADAGLKVICTDEDQTLLKYLAKGKTVFSQREIESKFKGFLKKNRICVAIDIENAISKSDIVVLTLSPNIDSKKHPDYSEIEKICKRIGKALNQNSLFIYGGVSGLGCVEGIIKETLENTSGLKMGKDFGLVYNPTKYISQNPLDSFANQEVKIGAIDEISRNSATNILGVITQRGVKHVPDFKIAEAALLFTITKEDTNCALANELALLCDKAGLDYFKTLKFVDLSELSYLPTVEAGENERNKTYLLLENAENLNAKLRVTTIARRVNEEIVRHALNLVKDALRSCGKPLRRARVSVLGNAKPAVREFIMMLEKKGAKASLYDPGIPRNEQANLARLFKRSLKEAVEGTDCVVIFTENDQFKRLNPKKLRAIMKDPSAIVDLIGLIEPRRFEKQGFEYRGLGRGVRKK